MKKIKMFMALFIAIFSCTSFVSCCEEEDDEFTGWWTDLSSVATVSDFNRINQAIANYELLSSYRYGGETHNHYATRDFFFDGGMYTSSSASHGPCRFIPRNTQITALHFINQNTVIIHHANLWDTSGLSNEEIAGRTYAGTELGDLYYYDSNPRTYTYVKQDNKIVISNGDIYTVMEGCLIKDGSSAKLSKYNPSKKF